MCYNTVHLENGDIFGDLTIAIKTIFIIDTMLILKYYKKKIKKLQMSENHIKLLQNAFSLHNISDHA